MYIFRLMPVAANFEKSAEQIIPLQLLAPAPVTAVHCAPLSVDIKMLPLYTVAANLEKSPLPVIPTQALDKALVIEVQLKPPSTDF